MRPRLSALTAFSFFAAVFAEVSVSGEMTTVLPLDPHSDGRHTLSPEFLDHLLGGPQLMDGVPGRSP